MRWYRLTNEERLAFGAPAGTDALGALAMSLDCWHKGESIYVAVMLLTAFVDESGTGGHDRIMLGGLAARSQCWFGFVPQWKKLLRIAKIPFSHFVDMENGKPPFEGWDKPKTSDFVSQVQPLILKYCDFGQTVAIDLETHKSEYRARLSDRVHKDSAYGLCARAMIEGITVVAMKKFGRGIRVNFIFENNEHYGDAWRIFNDCKAHLDNIKDCLGTIIPGEKIEFGGLQAADLIASVGRRYEKQTVFKTAEMGPKQRRKYEEGCPIWHVPLGEDHLPRYCQQAEEIALEKRGRRRARGFARRRERNAS